MSELDQVEEALHDWLTASRRCLELGVSDVDLCWGLSGVIDTWKDELHQELERIDTGPQEVGA